MLTKWVAAAVLVTAVAGCAATGRTAGAPAPTTPGGTATAPSPTATSGAARPPGLPAWPKPSSTMRCLTGTSRFAIDAERTTPAVCLTAGAVVDLPARAGTWTEVRSSDPKVVTCALAADTARCRGVAAGRAIITAVDGSGTWQVAISVA